ncbi:MAG: hypothetical protein COA99_02685 [Moraxellaceae bacterium]|nr:MAG: hypothetical protein COA99_02685 [Moraxellaceae bacterium]
MFKKRESIDRSKITGDFVTLSAGVVNYKVEGDLQGNGEWVVLVHGLIGPSFVWEKIVPWLLARNHRVLSYDLFGRGFSDRPNEAYSQEFFVNQLEDLLEVLDITDPVNLVGWSMGGNICRNFVERNPDKVLKLILIAPAFKFAASALVGYVFRSTFFGVAMNLAGELIMKKAVKTQHFFGQGDIVDYVNKATMQMQYDGFMRATISILRNMFPEKGSYQTLKVLSLPVLLLWGDQDKVTPIKNTSKVREVFLNCEVEIIINSKHAPHYEHPEQVGLLISNFLRS